MAAPRRPLRVRLETKVMVAVLVVFIALPAVTLWLVDERLRELMQRDADLALSTARGSFEQALELRRTELATRFRVGLRDARFLQILRLNDKPTLNDYLTRELLDVYNDDTELAFFFGLDGELFTAAHRQGAPAPVNDLATAVAPYVRAILQRGDAADATFASAGLVAVNGIPYQVVGVPVRLTERGLVGALIFGTRISNEALRSIQPPSSQILVTVGSQVGASTLKEPAENDAVLRQLANNGASGRDDMLAVGGQRFKPATGVLATPAVGQPIRYVVLSSTEEQLDAFERTRATLIVTSVAGILIGAAVVWFFVRRITRPLVELRDSAEAVGRGDFSRRIERFSNDECGELAEAFNRMTASLQTSRAELERAMQQVRTTQEQLIQSEKLSAVGQFVAGVAHELNNPLTAVVGFSELLQTMDTDAKTKAHLDRIAKSAHRCHKIVQSLLSFARQHPPERKLADLHTAIDEVLEIMAYELRTSDITVVREFAPTLPQIMADTHQLQQVFVNILSNARQAIEPVRREGRIAIRTRQVDGKVQLEFEDNGPGIKPEHLARIFDPFFTTKPVGKGTGLGLSLCYGIVQEHGGKILARSEPGRGAMFIIELPVATDAAPAVLRRGSVAPFAVPRGESNGRSVLVIDDEHWILELATELLRTDGYEVEAALGGQAAIELLGRRKFDVIVSDWKMPGLNGIRLYEHLAATDPAAAKRVLFMTGDVVSDTFQDFLREHDLACLSKPFAIGEFRAAIAKVFQAA